jgi:hypothetical protein
VLIGVSTTLKDLKEGIMKKRYLNSLISILAIALIGFTLPDQAIAASETLGFETQGLDLDAGTIVETTLSQVVEPSGVDFYISYNADFIPHAVLVIAALDKENVEMAFLNDVAFASVTADSIIGLTFTADTVDQPLGQNDTVVLRTDTGSVFKIGNAVEVDDASVTFSYEQLQ